GAYLSTAAAGVPTILHTLILTGPYTIKNVDYTVCGVFTNTTPVDAYRGAGRPEATYLLERVMDLVAAELKMDPAEVRRRNLIPARAGRGDQHRPDRGQRAPAPGRGRRGGPRRHPRGRHGLGHLRQSHHRRRRRRPGARLAQGDREGEEDSRPLARSLARRHRL